MPPTLTTTKTKTFWVRSAPFLNSLTNAGNPREERSPSPELHLDGRVGGWHDLDLDEVGPGHLPALVSLVRVGEGVGGGVGGEGRDPDGVVRRRELLPHHGHGNPLAAALPLASLRRLGT